MGKDRPFIVTFIGDLNFLGAVLSIISLLPNFTTYLGMEFRLMTIFSNAVIQLLISIILLIISYGFLKLKIWGYWLMVTINICFLVASIIFSLQIIQQASYQGILTALITLIFIVPTKKYFGKKICDW